MGILKIKIFSLSDLLYSVSESKVEERTHCLIEKVLKMLISQAV